VCGVLQVLTLPDKTDQQEKWWVHYVNSQIDIPLNTPR